MELRELEEVPTFQPRVNTAGLTPEQKFMVEQSDVQTQMIQWMANTVLIAHNLSVQNERRLSALSRERWMVIGGGTVILLLFRFFWK
jgi:hypothetical protein